MSGAGPAGTEQLRIAIAMNGGVSLAVWMGGVSLELARLARSEGLYGELLTLTGTEPVIDVISGTSAGGLNGAFLATALVHDTPLQPLRGLWIEVASFASLFRDPIRQPNPPSLLRGDDYFLVELQRVFRQLAPRGSLRPVEDAPMDLTLMATQLEGRETKLADDFGTVIAEVDHRARFRFQRGVGIDRDAFADPHVVDQLSLAARTSASFPGAFEASWIPINPEKPPHDRPDMAAVASETMTASGYAVDGGVLDNKPVEAALEGIRHQRAGQRFRRVLLYVVPDPGVVHAADATGPPTLGSVVFASLVSIPRNETIVTALRQAREENRGSEEAMAARLALGALSVPQLYRLARDLFDVYVAVRTDRSVRYIVSELSAGLAQVSGVGLPYRGRRELLQKTFAAASLPWIPELAPTSASDFVPSGWRWGNRPVEEGLLLAVTALQWADSLTYDQAEAPLADAWRWYYAVRAAAKGDQPTWRKLGSTIGPDQPVDSEWADGILAAWAGQESDLPELAAASRYAAPTTVTRNEAAAWMMLETASLLQSIAARSRDGSGPDPGNMRRLLYLLSPDDADVLEVVRRLLCFHVITSALGRGPEVQHQIVDVMQVSADTPSPFNPVLRVAIGDKLSGVQLGHFGAFYKRAWRANDWMHGRLDGAARIVQLVLSPAALRRAFPSTAEAVAGLERLAGASAEGPLREHWRRDLRVLATELAFLDDRQAPAPDGVPITVAAVARRLQAEIAAEELATVARSAERDALEGPKPDSKSSRFVHAFLARTGDSSPIREQVIPTEDAIALLPECRVGEERVADDMGTDRFADTVATTLAVSTAAMNSKTSGLGALRLAVRFARAPLVLLYLLIRNSATTSAISSAVTAAAMTFGLTVVVLNLFTDAVDAIAPVGWGLLLASVLALVLRRRWVTIGLGVLAAAVGVVVAVAAEGWENILRTASPYLAFGAFLLFVGGFPWVGTRRKAPSAGGPDAELRQHLLVEARTYFDTKRDQAADDAERAALSKRLQRVSSRLNRI